jgi:hypothetical protein
MDVPLTSGRLASPETTDDDDDDDDDVENILFCDLEAYLLHKNATEAFHVSNDDDDDDSDENLLLSDLAASLQKKMANDPCVCDSDGDDDENVLLCDLIERNEPKRKRTRHGISAASAEAPSISTLACPICGAPGETSMEIMRHVEYECRGSTGFNLRRVNTRREHFTYHTGHIPHQEAGLCSGGGGGGGPKQPQKSDSELAMALREKILAVGNTNENADETMLRFVRVAFDAKLWQGGVEPFSRHDLAVLLHVFDALMAKLDDESCRCHSGWLLMIPYMIALKRPTGMVAYVNALVSTKAKRQKLDLSKVPEREILEDAFIEALAHLDKVQQGSERLKKAYAIESINLETRSLGPRKSRLYHAMCRRAARSDGDDGFDDPDDESCVAFFLQSKQIMRLMLSIRRHRKKAATAKVMEDKNFFPAVVCRKCEDDGGKDGVADGGNDVACGDGTRGELLPPPREVLARNAALPLTPPASAMHCSADHTKYEAQYLGRVCFTVGFGGQGAAVSESAGVAAGEWHLGIAFDGRLLAVFTRPSLNSLLRNEY